MSTSSNAEAGRSTIPTVPRPASALTSASRRRLSGQVLTSTPVEIDGTPYHLFDTAGLDGAAPRVESLATEMLETDFVLWVIRADRPARAPDGALLARLRALRETLPERRPVPILPVVTGIDLVIGEWPRPEHHLDAAGAPQIEDLVGTIAEDPGLAGAVPVSLAEPAWNVASVGASLARAFPETFAVQRNRARSAARPGAIPAAASDVRRAGRGMGSGASRLGRAVLRRRGRDDPPGPGRGTQLATYMRSRRARACPDAFPPLQDPWVVILRVVEVRGASPVTANAAETLVSQGAFSTCRR